MKKHPSRTCNKRSKNQNKSLEMVRWTKLSSFYESLKIKVSDLGFTRWKSVLFWASNSAVSQTHCSKSRGVFSKCQWFGFKDFKGESPQAPKHKCWTVLPIVRSNRSGSNPPAPYKRRYAALRRNADVWVMGRCHRLLSTFWSNVWLRRPTANIDGLPKPLECFGCDWDSHSVTDLYCRWLGCFRRVFCAVLPVIPSCGTSGWTFLVSTSEHK